MMYAIDDITFLFQLDTMITPSNIDEKLDEVLSKKIDYEFAIDQKGRRYMDTKSLPVKEKSSGENDELKDQDL